MRKMSDLGLFGSVYEQLHEYSDQFNKFLFTIRRHDGIQRTEARLRLAQLLRSVTDKQNNSPSAHIVRMVLQRELPRTLGQPVSICDTLADALEHRDPLPQELESLGKISIAVNTECYSTMERMQGKI